MTAYVGDGGPDETGRDILNESRQVVVGASSGKRRDRAVTWCVTARRRLMTGRYIFATNGLAGVTRDDLRDSRLAEISRVRDCRDYRCGHVARHRDCRDGR